MAFCHILLLDLKKPGSRCSKSYFYLMGSNDCFDQTLTANHAAIYSHMLADTSNCPLVGICQREAEVTELSLAE